MYTKPGNNLLPTTTVRLSNLRATCIHFSFLLCFVNTCTCAIISLCLPLHYNRLKRIPVIVYRFVCQWNVRGVFLPYGYWLLLITCLMICKYCVSSVLFENLNQQRTFIHLIQVHLLILERFFIQSSSKVIYTYLILYCNLLPFYWCPATLYNVLSLHNLRCILQNIVLIIKSWSDTHNESINNNQAKLQ